MPFENEFYESGSAYMQIFFTDNDVICHAL